MTENAKLDGNFVATKLAVLNTDTVQGTNKVRIQLNESNNFGLCVDHAATIAFTMQPIDEKDENYKDCMMFVGSDGLTYPWVATANGCVLIEL